ncbi:hypothetical protein A2U01_0090707, partial [Trifolium medium]|nr:hypothetical protein [Trifolium medium]
KPYAFLPPSPSSLIQTKNLKLSSLSSSLKPLLPFSAAQIFAAFISIYASETQFER